MSETPILKVQGVSKRFGGVHALENVSLELYPGEVLALAGDNGAGKSTLIKIISGVLHPDEGTIWYSGSEVTFENPQKAREHGIETIYQDLALADNLDVGANVFLGREPLKRVLGFPVLDRKQMRTQAAGALRVLDIQIHRFDLPIRSLSGGQRQAVAIGRAIHWKAKILIMDEPTSVLTPQAVKQLFATLRRLADEGMSILYISHKLEEIRTLCDTATVLRAGKVSGTARPRDESNASLARLMVGSDLEEQPLKARAAGEVRLELKGYSMAARDPFGTALSSIDLAVRAGEIVGIAGVSGNGQKELLSALSGETIGAHAGSISLCGRDVDALGAAQR